MHFPVTIFKPFSLYLLRSFEALHGLPLLPLRPYAGSNKNPIAWHGVLQVPTPMLGHVQELKVNYEYTPPSVSSPSPRLRLRTSHSLSAPAFLYPAIKRFALHWLQRSNQDGQ